MGVRSFFRDLVTASASQSAVVSGLDWSVMEYRAASPAAYDPAPLLGGGQRRVAWSDDELLTVHRESFRIAGIVFRCGTLIADAFAESPLRVYREVDGQPEEDPTHWARALFAEPNPEQGEAEFWNTVVLISFINGYALVEKVRNRLDEVVQLYPRTPDSLKRRAKAGGEYVWEQRIKGELVRELPDRDVFAVPYQFDPNLQRRGISPVQVLGKEIGIEGILTDYLKRFLDSGGIPPFYLTSKDPLADGDTADSARERWSQKMGGGQSWDSPPFLAGIDIERVGLDLNEMAWPDLRGINELRIFSTMGVPAHLGGALEALRNGGLSTTELKEAMAFFQMYTISGLRNRADAAFTRAVLREREPDRSWSLEFDTKRIKALQEDETKKQERARANAVAGLITLEEVRPVLGYDPKPTAGDTFLRPFSAVESIAGQEPEPPALPATVPPAKQALRYRDVGALNTKTLELRASLADRNRKAQRKLTEILDRAMRKFFAAQGDRIISQLKAAPDVAVKLEVDDIDWDDEARALGREMDQFYQRAGTLAFEEAADITNTSISWDLANPNVGRVLDQLGGAITEITETTRADVARIIGDALNEGTTLEALAGKLKAQFTETYKNRALAIARTESMRAYSAASVLGYQESGVVADVEFMDNPAHDTDPGSDGLTCAQRDGLVTKLAEAQKHIDAEHPNGTLAVLPVIDIGE